MSNTVDMSRQDVAFVLPAFNEERDLPALLRRISSTMADQPFRYHVVIVDDGSKDRTAEIAEEFAKTMPIRLVRHVVNQGLGAAIQTGLSEAVKGADFIVTMDSDNSHDPMYVRNMVDFLNERKDMGLVIASRYRPGSEVKGLASYRKLLSYGCFFTMKLLVPYRGVRDYSTGFRCYRASTLHRLILHYGSQMVQETGFVCQLELLLKLRAVNAQAAEIPYVLRYDLKEGASKLRIWRTVKRYFAVVHRYYRRLPQQKLRELDAAMASRA
jgi:dolichol-phosphate mannosyltransferase